jgi:hypothetical protein
VSRAVKGTLFADYVRMLRGRKDVDWSRHLEPADKVFLVERIEADSWYPMDTFERMGLAILAEIAGGDLEVVRGFGSMSMDWLVKEYAALVAHGDPRDSLMRFKVLRGSFFDYSALELTAVSDGEASLRVNYGMSALAEEAAAWQTLGFFQRLLEVAGGSDVQAWFASRSWAGGLVTEIQMRWTDPFGQ